MNILTIDPVEKENKFIDVVYAKSVILEVKEADNMMAVYVNADNDHGPNSSTAYQHHMNGFGAGVILNDIIDITPLLGQLPEDFKQDIVGDNKDDYLTIICSNFESEGKFVFTLKIDDDAEKSFRFDGNLEKRRTCQLHFKMKRQ